MEPSQSVKPDLLHYSLLAHSFFLGLLGVVFMFVPEWVGAFLGHRPPGVMIMIGLGFVLFSVTFYFTAHQNPMNQTFSAMVIIFDTAWVIGSAHFMMTGWFPVTQKGNWGVLIVAGIIAILAAIQTYALRELIRSSPS